MRKSVFFHGRGLSSGFTLIELMVTVAVLVILATVAVPGLQDFVARSGMTSIRNDFSVALQRARADAINRNTCVSICQMASGKQNICAAPAEQGNWHRGWIIHVNNACATTAPTAALPAEDIIAVRQPGNERYRLIERTQGTPESLLTFDARGTLVTGGITFEATDASVDQSPNARNIVINMQGRVAVRAPDAESSEVDGEETASTEGE